MSWISGFWRSALGKKAVMAVSGILLFAFVFLHMAGNLKVYQGPEKYNAYAEWLRQVGTPALPRSGLLWIARVMLLAAVVLHIWAAWALTLVNRRARPVGYAERQTVAATYAARTMRWGGVILLLFVFYHLAHFTWGFRWAHPDFVPGDVYHNFVVGFRSLWVSGFYIAAQAALGLHLYHGLWSMFQTLGWNHPAINPWRRSFAAAFAGVITLGNVSFPLAVMMGVVG